MSEKNIQQEVRMALSAHGIVNFRNNSGNGVAGSHMRRIEKAGQYRLDVGDYVVKHGSRIQYGLCVGSSDLVGWRQIIITPEMVGQCIGQFVAVEVKTPTGKATDDQKNFINQVRKAGGLAGIVRSGDDVISLLNQLKSSNQ